MTEAVALSCFEQSIAVVRESKGVTLILPEAVAQAKHLGILFRAAWITLEIVTELEMIGLSARIASALASNGIACNIVAGAFHDHVFVPAQRADDALRILESLTIPAR